jgi:hypothetical protein
MRRNPTLLLQALNVVFSCVVKRYFALLQRLARPSQHSAKIRALISQETLPHLCWYRFLILARRNFREATGTKVGHRSISERHHYDKMRWSVGRNSPCRERVCDWTSALEPEKIIQDLWWVCEVLCMQSMHCCHNWVTLLRVILGFNFVRHVLCHELWWLKSIHWRGDTRRAWRQSFSASRDVYVMK